MKVFEYWLRFFELLILIVLLCWGDIFCEYCRIFYNFELDSKLMNLYILGCYCNVLVLSLFYFLVVWIIVIYYFWYLILKIILRCKFKREFWLRNSLSLKVYLMVWKIWRIWIFGFCYVYFMVICDVIVWWDFNLKFIEVDFLLNLYMFILNINYKRLYEMFYFRNILWCNDVIIFY